MHKRDRGLSSTSQRENQPLMDFIFKITDIVNDAKQTLKNCKGNQNPSVDLQLQDEFFNTTGYTYTVYSQVFPMALYKIEEA